MFDTVITIVGNALNTPEWRRLGSNQALVAKFKVAATSRRYDKEHGRWVDGTSLRVRVNCWRRLAENVSASVLSGDPVIVTGRMYTRDWIGEDGQRRVSYELDAVAVGHDLARGQSKFTRHKHPLSTTVVDDEQAESRIAGERTEPVAPRRVSDDPSVHPQVLEASDSAIEASDSAIGGVGDDTGGGDQGESGASDDVGQTEAALATFRAAGLSVEPFEIATELDQLDELNRSTHDWSELRSPAELVGADRD